MNRQTCTETSTEGPVERTRIQEKRPVQSRKGVDPGQRGGWVCGRGRVLIVILIASMPWGLSMTGKEEDRSLAIFRQGILFTETDVL